MFLTHNIGMKLIVNALLGSVGGITNVLLVVAVVFLIFAILFVNLYKGRFFYCSLDPYILHTAKDCSMLEARGNCTIIILTQLTGLGLLFTLWQVLRDGQISWFKQLNQHQ